MTDALIANPMIRPPLDTSVLAQRVLVYDEIESTNDQALRLGGDGTLVIAERQTLGRGRLGRAWHSAAGLGLWFSLGFDGHIEGLQVSAALAVREAVRAECELKIKWPNDLLYNNRKICGILVEHKDDRTAVGIGINVRHTIEDFPEELRMQAGSLYIATGKKLDRADLLKRILNAFERSYVQMLAGNYVDLHAEWVDACDVLGKRIKWGVVEGKVTAIDHRGALCVETKEGSMQLLSGDITSLDSAV
jgi:BirA family biotin operon repressor/biotin-[acetyl-CoA-carboxylase] ligase